MEYVQSPPGTCVQEFESPQCLGDQRTSRKGPRYSLPPSPLPRIAVRVMEEKGCFSSLSSWVILNQFSPPFTENIAQKPPFLKTVGAFKWALLRIHFSGALQMPFGSVMRPMSFCRVADIRTNFKLGRRCITTSSPTGAESKGGGPQSTYYSSIYQSLYLCICIVFFVYIYTCVYIYIYVYIHLCLP